MRDQWSDWIGQLQGTIGFLGLGHELRGDDTLGLVLARELQARGLPHVHLAGTTPERWIHEANLGSLDHLVFLDAVDWGGCPGEVVLLAASEIQQRFPQVSTHKLSLGLLAGCVVSRGNIQAWLLGIQPETITHGQALSMRVRHSIALVAELLADGLSAKPPVIATSN